jgi:hypothetical protein
MDLSCSPEWFTTYHPSGGEANGNLNYTHLNLDNLTFRIDPPSLAEYNPLCINRIQRGCERR